MIALLETDLIHAVSFFAFSLPGPDPDYPIPSDTLGCIVT